MRKTPVVLLAVLGLAWSPAPLPREDPADLYFARLEALWQQQATLEDVEALVQLLTPDAVYEHPRVGMRIEGRTAIRDAMAGFLGTSREPRIQESRIERGAGVAVLVFDLRMEVRAEEAWRPVVRRQIVVLDLTDGRISRVSDYW